MQRGPSSLAAPSFLSRKDTPDEITANDQAGHYVNWEEIQRSQKISRFSWFFGSHSTPEIREDLRSNAIHPMSPFARFLIAVSVVLSFYCFFEMPVLLSFNWNAPSCWKPPTLELDMAVEVFFVLEIIIAFFIGVYDTTGKYLKKFVDIAKWYLKGQFWFDLLTAAPITWVEWYLVHRQGCTDHDDETYKTVKASIRIIRPLRLLKIFKLLRMSRVWKHLHLALSTSYWAQRLFALILQFICIIHIFLCSFWLIKELTNNEAEMTEFLNENNIPLEEEAGVMFTLERYVLAGYFVNTVFTTVGFGDVHGTNSAERLFIIVAMWTGALVFSTTISSMQEYLHAQQDSSTAYRLQRQDVKNFLERELVPATLQGEIFEWLDKTTSVDQEREQQNQLLHQLPPDLQQQMVLHMTKALFDQLPLVARVPPGERDDLVVALARGATFQLVRKGALLATLDELLMLGRLFVVVSGRVVVRIVHDEEDWQVRGDFFGSLDRGEDREALRIIEAGQETVISQDEDASAFKAYAFFADRSSEIAIITQELLHQILPSLSPEVQDAIRQVPKEVPLFSESAKDQGLSLRMTQLMVIAKSAKSGIAKETYLTEGGRGGSLSGGCEQSVSGHVGFFVDTDYCGKSERCGNTNGDTDEAMRCLSTCDERPRKQSPINLFLPEFKSGEEMKRRGEERRKRMLNTQRPAQLDLQPIISESSMGSHTLQQTQSVRIRRGSKALHIYRGALTPSPAALGADVTGQHTSAYGPLYKRLSKKHSSAAGDMKHFDAEEFKAALLEEFKAAVLEAVTASQTSVLREVRALEHKVEQALQHLETPHTSLPPPPPPRGYVCRDDTEKEAGGQGDRHSIGTFSSQRSRGVEGGGSIAAHMNKFDENIKGQTTAIEVFGMRGRPEQPEHEISFHPPSPVCLMPGTELCRHSALPEPQEEDFQNIQNKRIAFLRYNQASAPVREVVLGSNLCATIF